MIGTEIWRNICERAAVNEKYEVLQARYQHTPWIVNAPSEGREDDLRDWCREQYGHEYWHVFADEDRQWQWQGGCYVCGHTWFGFHKREQLEAFCSTWDIEMPNEAD